MAWIQTFSGRRFDPCEPAGFAIEDIAHALSNLCRFNGHCREFYSVAEHSVRASQLCSAPHQMWALLHDMGEAYVGDLPRPIKARLPQHVEYEERVLRAAAIHFGLQWPIPAEVHEVDDRMLATEARDLMGVDAREWGIGAEPLKEPIAPWPAAAAKEAFLKRFAELET